MTQRDGNIRHFIYPLTSTGDFYLEGGKDVTPENLLRGALRGATDSWGLSTNYRVIEPGDWIWAYFGGNVRRIHAVGTVDAPIGYDKKWRHRVHIRWDPHLTRDLQDRPIRYEDYRQTVMGAAGRANATTTSVLEQWLDGAVGTSRAEVVRVSREVLQRLGQPAFRADALQIFSGRCAVTGVSETSVLQAAHIVPVADGGTHAASNALLLRSDLHNLFDLGRLTVTRDLRVRLSPDVTDPTYRALDGARVRAPSGIDRAAFVTALSKHRERWLS